jgi:hypothetical protein
MLRGKICVSYLVPRTASFLGWSPKSKFFFRFAASLLREEDHAGPTFYQEEGSSITLIRAMFPYAI